MRRALIAMMVVLVPAMAAMGEHQGDYRDDFNEISFSGSDGGLHWATKWVEIGENDGPGGGAVHVGPDNCADNKCLHIEGNGVLPNPAISRKADLSGFETAKLSFELFADPALVSVGTLSVEARGSGSVWTPLESYVLLTSGGEHSESFDITGLIGSDFEIRFRLSGLLAGDVVTVDRVVIEGPLEPTSTTTTTVKLTTTSTTKATTTTTRAPTTTSTVPTTTTTRPPTTSTSRAETTTTVSDAASSTSSTSTTSTTISLAGGGAGPTDGNEPPPIGGLRDPGVGLMADYSEGMMGDLDMGDVEVLGVELSADFSMAVEVFETARIWLAVLALLVAAAIIAGLDRRRTLL